MSNMYQYAMTKITEYNRKEVNVPAVKLGSEV